MRQLLHLDMHGTDVDEVLGVFNATRESLHIRESDVVSVSVLPAEPEYVLNLKFGQKPANVRVVIAYWA